MRMNWEYIAGFFDGEGCVSTGPNAQRKGAFNTRICIAQSGNEGKTVLTLMKVFLETHGIQSSICDRGVRRGTNRPMFILRMWSRLSVERFLAAMLPLVSVKRVVVEDTLRFLRLYPSVRGPETTNRNRERSKYGSHVLDVGQLKADRASGMIWTAIASKHGVNSYTIRRHIDPSFRAKYNAQRRAMHAARITRMKAERLLEEGV